MLRIETWPSLKCGPLYSSGGFIFYKADKAFVLTDKGNTGMVKADVAYSLQKGVLPTDQRSYFLQRGIILPNTEHIVNKCVTYFIIDLVKNCNFNCIYCFRNLKDKRVISMETLDRVLGFIVAYCEERRLYRIGLQMWGGEPLLCMDRIEYTVDFFRKSRITATIDVETNGSLVTEEVAQKLYRLGIRIGVSLDGIPELHNRQRPFENGLPTADKVRAGIENLQKYYGNDIGGITVVTKYNYKYVKEMLNYYIYELGLNSHKFNIVRDNSNASSEGLSLTAADVTWFAGELLDYLFAFLNMGNSFREGNMVVRVRNLLYQHEDNLCMSRGCQGGRRIISFSQNGDIFPCEMTDFEEERIGSIFSGIPLDQMINDAIQKNLFFKPKEAEYCKSCPWHCYCRGGCTSRNRYMGLSGVPDECECAMNRTIYPRIVEAILDGFIGG